MSDVDRARDNAHEKRRGRIEWWVVMIWPSGAYGVIPNAKPPVVNGLLEVQR